MEFEERVNVSFKVNGKMDCVEFTNNYVEKIDETSWFALFQKDDYFVLVCGSFTENEFIYESLDHDVYVSCVSFDDNGEWIHHTVTDVDIQPVI